MPKSLLQRVCAGLAVAALVAMATQPASAAPVNFTGNAQTLSISATADGSADAALEGLLIFPFIQTPPTQSFVIALNPATVTAKANPVSNPLDTTDVAVNGTTLTGVTGLNLNMFNNLSPNPLVVNLKQIKIILQYDTDDPPDGIYDTPGSLRVDLQAAIKSLNFNQSAVTPTFGPGNTFSIPGTLSGKYDYTIKLNGTGVATETDNNFDAGLPLAGNYTITPVGGGMGKLSLDGTVSVPNPVTLSTFLATDLGIAALTGQINLFATINIAAAYHLEALVPIPEPGSIALLGLGVLGLVPVAHRRYRKSRVRENAEQG